MKKYINFAIILAVLASVTLTSCKNEVDEIFDKDSILRLEESMANFRQILVADGGRWQMEYFANDEEQGYVYLMTFNDNGAVTISGKNIWIADKLGESAINPLYASETSYWDVIGDNGPVLTFNTYNNVFHIFADPEDITDLTDEDPDEQGYGHSGDYEFDLMSYSNDTLYLVGKKHELSLIMTRLHSDLTDEAYMDSTVANVNNFFSSKIPYVFMNLPNGRRWYLENGASQIFTLYAEDADKITTAVTANGIITLAGLSFMVPFTAEGYTVQRFALQDDGSLLCREDNQTTITADHLSNVLMYNSFTWQFNTQACSDKYTSLFTAIASELKAFNSSTPQTYTLSYVSKQGLYALNVRIQLKSKKVFNFIVYYKAERLGDEQVKFTRTEPDESQMSSTEKNNYNNSLTYLEKAASLNTLLNELLNGTTFTLTANSLLAPTQMTLTESSSAYVVLNLQ